MIPRRDLTNESFIPVAKSALFFMKKGKTGTYSRKWPQKHITGILHEILFKTFTENRVLMTSQKTDNIVIRRGGGGGGR